MEFSATTPSPLSSTTTGKVSFITILFCSWLMIHNSTALFPPATPAPTTPNESLRLVGGSLSPSTCDASPNESLRLVGGSLIPSTCDASHIDPQRVITTRWRLSLPLHLRRQPQRPPMSHYDSLGALSPPPPATPATSTLGMPLFGSE